MRAIGNVILDIDEALADVMSMKVVDNHVLEMIAERLGVPVMWVKDRYDELCNDW